MSIRFDDIESKFLKRIDMSTTVEIVSNINEFLRDNIVDKNVIEFLVELKMKVLELDEQSQSRRRIVKEQSQLETLLRSMGKKCFVDCYYQLKMVHEGKLSNASEAIKECSKADGNSLRTKASVGIRIFKLALDIEALKSISEAEKVPPKVRKSALEIFEKESR